MSKNLPNQNLNHEVVTPTRPLSPQHFLEAFCVAFVQNFTEGDNAPVDGFYKSHANIALEGAWASGYAKGREEGYAKAVYDMELAQHKAGQFVNNLKQNNG
jgi:hypothetical protein